MNAYALVGYLDYESEKIFLDVWQELSKNNISQYGVESKGKRPHITIADYDNVDKENFIRLLNEYYDGKLKVNITLNVLGTFINSGTLFTAPTLTGELIDFHTSHHKCLGEFNDNENSFYLPGRWNPHLTIASRLSRENMIKAFEYCSKSLNKINGKINEIALIEIRLDDNGIAVEDTVIFLKELQNI